MASPPRPRTVVRESAMSSRAERRRCSFVGQPFRAGNRMPIGSGGGDGELKKIRREGIKNAWLGDLQPENPLDVVLTQRIT